MTLGRKFISIITLAFVVFALSAVSFGQETPTTTDKSDAVKKDGKRGKYGRKGRHGKRGRAGRRGRGGRRGGSALRGITLNDSQKQQLQTLFQSNRGNRGNRRSGGNDEVRNLMRLKRSGLATSAQETQLKGITDKHRSDRAAARTKMDQSIRSILTAEQQQQYDKNLAERKQKMEGRKNMRKERKNSQPSKNN